LKKAEDELLERLSNMMEVPFSDDLHRRILQSTMQQQVVRKRRRRFDWRGLAAGVGGVSAATVLIWGAWNYGSSLPTNAALLPSARAANISSSVLGDNTLGLQLAPISVQYLGNEGKEVKASLVNIGTETLRQQDYVGVLSFQPSADPNLLEATDWIMFVDPPKQTLAPGDSADWSFHPVTAPVNQQTGNLSEKPRLVFFNQETPIPTKADVKWGLAPFTVTDSPKANFVQVIPSGTGKKYEVHETIQNTSIHDVSLDNCLAIIWFSINPDDNWTASEAVRFIVTIAEPKEGPVVKAHQQVQLTSHLIAGLNPDLTKMYAHVEFIHR
jgi:hypothetical protein